MGDFPKTAVDYLRMRTRCSPGALLPTIKGVFSGHRVAVGPLRPGRWGYSAVQPIHIGKEMVASIHHDGPSQRGWLLLDLPGTGCRHVAVGGQLLELAALPDAAIRRLDIALTTVNGEVTHQKVVDAHAAGLFRSGGRNPQLLRMENSDPTRGNTCAIGTRAKSDKYLRGYERGHYLAHHAPWLLEGRRDLALLYRLELELKVQTRPIPWDAIERRDDVFAGAYPFLAGLLPGATPYRPPLVQAPSAAQALEGKLDNIRRQYGDVLHTALSHFDGDADALLMRIVGAKHSPSLKALVKPRRS